MIVEAYELDVLREPRLATADLSASTIPLRELTADLEQDGNCIVIAGSQPCKFLRADNECGIYPTRPNSCVAMQAGDEQCQAARTAENLPPLMPKHDSIAKEDDRGER